MTFCGAVGHVPNGKCFLLAIWTVNSALDTLHWESSCIKCYVLIGDNTTGYRDFRILSQWRMAKFDPAQIRNPWTDRHKIWNR